MPLYDIFYVDKPSSFSFVIIALGIFLTSNVWNDETTPILAQPTPLSSPSPASVTLNIQITSHQEGQRVPAGELTVKGISSDNQDTDCQVYADVNDMTPMPNATATGATGNPDDFSKWTFTYTERYQLIKVGTNELTAKISCFGLTSPSDTSISEWHTVNVTGISTTSGNSIIPPQSFSLPLPPTGDFESDDNEAGEEEDVSDALDEDGSEDEDNGDDMQGSSNEEDDDDEVD